jgi:hypothetical protein
MDALSTQFKAMIEKATARCEAATDADLETWAATDTILALFAQKELVYRDQQAALDLATAVCEVSK